jgi:ribosomal protein S6
MFTKANIFIYLTILALNLIYINTKLNPSNVEIAINCGGPEFRTKSGVTYQKDNYFEGGEASDFGMNSDIKNTKDKEIYQTERWSSKDLDYNIPLKNDGKYVLVLKFSEVYFNSKGEKVFDFKIGETTILENIDIFEKVGKNNAYDEYIEFELKKNKICVDGKEAVNGYDEDNKKLQISFDKKEADNPKINAILIVRGTLKDTDYDEYQRTHELLEKQKQEIEKKNREFQRMSKSIDFEDFEDDFTDDGKKYRVSNGIFSGQSLFVTLIAIGGIYFFFFTKKR